ncbi:bifunctional UDP-sugar hydrolase/5'-nucleotidase [uncultured Dysosmobacter sp.]|uniref:bifunctional metallophosphatase/5'-nucleotidase n=1 Tax=uncultured Dysosmobacter sp. TaxID=2591384 RepID=UPI002619C29E|nr:bifunctional metallophosphatase/5'-nucleotidase [uncultured Dysosmobacter sp.]
MTSCKRLCAGALCALLLVLVGTPAAAAVGEAPPLTILFTHDTHDHFYPDAAGKGGYSRLSALLDEQRAEAASAGRAVVTVDGGDFSMGSLFQTIYASSAPELRALGAMGYDVTTLGNHEFDYRQRGLAEMLRTARACGDPLPALVQANYTTPLDAEAGQDLIQAMADYPVTDYVVLERQGLRIAVFGLLGLDAHDCAPMSGMAYQPIEAAARRVVAEIEAREQADYIICLSHSGTEDGKGEDYALAKAVDGIDVIISGHTHSTTLEPIQVNDTLIVSCGEYTQNLGVLTVSQTDGIVALADYRLLPIDRSSPSDPELEALTEAFQAEVDGSYLAAYGLAYDQVLCQASSDFTTPETGELIGDAYTAAIRRLEGPDAPPVDFAVAPAGVIRDVLRQGGVTTANAFDILSLGSGADGTPGYPLVSVYLTGSDLKNAFEVDASISGLMPAAALYGAGMTWTWNPHRMFLDRVTGCAQLLPDGGTAEIQPDRLYRVVADLYSGQMLGAVESQSMGLLSVTPRDEAGAPVTDLEDCIVKDDGGGEVKAWYALASYLEEQETVSPGGSRKVMAASWSPLALLASPGPSTLAVLGALLLLLVLAVLLTVLIRRRKRQKRR